MVINSPQLADGINVELEVIGAEGNILVGNLSDELPSDTYHIVGDIVVPDGETLTLSPGTEFQFDNNVSLGTILNLFSISIFLTLSLINESFAYSFI